MNDSKLAKMAAEGDKRAVRLARLTSQPARFLATIQVAITLSGFDPVRREIARINTLIRQKEIAGQDK